MTDLYPEWRVGAISLTEPPYAVPFGGVDYGTPENVTEILQSLLQDGDIELSSRTGNRTLVLPVLIEDSDMAALAEAEAALVLECDKPRNEVYVDPGDGFAPPFYFDVFRGQLTFSRDDNYEINGFRSYTLTFRALPFSRSADEVITPALGASGSTTTLVDNGSATTGWTGEVSGTATAPAVSSGAVGIESAAIGGTVTMSLTRTGSIDTTSTKYLMVDWRGVADFPLRAFGDEVELERVSQAASPTAGYVRSWFYVPGTGVTALRFTQSSYWPFGTSVRPLFVDNINRTDVRPTFGSARQLLRTIEVQGSARTQGRLAIEHPSSALGYVLAYVWTGGAEGYSPPLRQYRISGGTVTTDATKVSGAHEPIKSTTVTYEIPVSRLTPGLHLLMLQLVTSSGVSGSDTSLTYTTTTRLNGTNVSDTFTGTVTIPPASINSGATVGFATIGRLSLPTQDIDANSGAVQRITLNATTTLADLAIDEGWLFHSSGQLTGAYAQFGTPALGGPSNRMFIEPASIGTPRPTVRIGTNADRSDARYPRTTPLSWQQPQFAPPLVNVFTVTTGATDADVTLAHAPRWHTNAAA